MNIEKHCLKYWLSIILAIVGIVAFIFLLSATVYPFSLGVSGVSTPTIPITIYLLVGLVTITGFIFLVIVPFLFIKEIKKSEFLQSQIDIWIKNQDTG